MGNYYSLIGSKEDPGDSLHRTCMALLGRLWFNGASVGLPIQFLIDDHWVRHPSPGWWRDKDRLSRDQATPLVILMGEVNRTNYIENDLLRQFFIAHIKRLGFFTNTRRNGATEKNDGMPKYKHPRDGVYDYSWKLPDFITFEFIGIYIRAFRAWYLYPVLLLTDLETLVGSFLWLYREDEDVLNHLIISNYFKRVYPTPVSLLAFAMIGAKRFNSKMEKYFTRVGLLSLFKLWRMDDKSMD